MDMSMSAKNMRTIATRKNNGESFTKFILSRIKEKALEGKFSYTIGAPRSAETSISDLGKLVECKVILDSMGYQTKWIAFNNDMILNISWE